MRLGWILQYLARAEAIVNNRFLYQKIFLPLVRGQAQRMEKLPPSTVLIEGTNKCNAQCITCPHKYMKRPVGVMDFKLYKKIVDECRELNVYSVHPYGFGEPLLDPLLVERISYAKKKGIPYVPIFSNWSVIDEKKIVDLINSGLDEITVGYEGFDQEAFERVRLNLKFAEVNSNIEKFLKIRKSMGKTKPFINLFTTRRKDNKQQTKDIYKKWKRKVNEVFVWPASNWTGDVDSICMKRPKPAFPCIVLWDTLTIHWNGDAVSCSSNYEGWDKLGNMKDSSIMAIRSSPLLQKYRDKHLKGQQQELELCRGCKQIPFSWPRWFMRMLSRVVGSNIHVLKK